MRERPVASEKIAVDRASRRRESPCSTRASIGGASVAAFALCYHRPARATRAFFRMPNIQQQKKRVRIAGRQRLENLRYRSTVKTLSRRLERAVADGNSEQATAEH